jgi:hypothetical protein
MIEGFYATTRDGQRWAPLLGPYDSHQEALDNVDRARAYVQQNWTDRCWWSYDTARIATSAMPLPKGKLNDRIGLTEASR